MQKLEKKLDMKLSAKFESFKRDFSKDMDIKMTTLASDIEKNITTLIQSSLDDLTTSMKVALSTQVGSFMEDFSSKIIQATNGSSKRTPDPIVSPPPKQRKAPQNIFNGQGNHNNTTCMTQPNEAENAIQE